MSRTLEELTGRYEEIYSVGNGDEENEAGIVILEYDRIYNLESLC